MKNYIVYTILLWTLTTSCEKLVEVEVPNSQIASVQVFNDLGTANAALAGLYAGLYENSPVAGDQAGSLLGTYTDDLDYYASNASNGIFDIYKNQQISTNSSIYSFWFNAYQKIYVANAIIEGAGQSTALLPAEKARIRSEALFVRSLLYFYLQQVFGDIPFPTTTDYKVNQSLGKIAANQILDYLAADLTEAISYLPDDYTNSERIYPNRKVAQLLLAKVLMLQGKWNEAEILLRSIALSPLYPFQNDITKVFTKTSQHILWQLKPKNAGDPTREFNAYYFANAAPTTYALSTDLLNTFTATDLRKQNWMTPVTKNGVTWYRPYKYKNAAGNQTECSIVFRIDEVYLLLAESLAQQNKLTQALPYLNATRLRAGLPAISVTSTQNDLLNEIQLEARKEFFTEMGHRFLDLKRMGKLNVLVNTKLNWKTYHSQWPIPQQELLLNSNLHPQNSGY